MLLEVENLTVRYGRTTALDGISINVDDREIVAILGPNGSGKSTLLKTISGLISSYSGSIRYQGLVINGIPAFKLVRMGISLVPQGRHIFTNMNVFENLELGGYTLRNKQEVLEQIKEIVRIFPWLEERRTQRAGLLSGGEQQMLALARGLMVKPKLLLLDEPTAGLSEKYVSEILIRIQEIQKRGTTVVIVEHKASTVLKVADKSYNFDQGKVVSQIDPRHQEHLNETDSSNSFESAHK